MVNEGVCVCERVIEKSLIAIGMGRVKASVIGKGGLDRIDSWDDTQTLTSHPQITVACGIARVHATLALLDSCCGICKGVAGFVLGVLTLPA